jgi:hypothetical protein
MGASRGPSLRSGVCWGWPDEPGLDTTAQRTEAGERMTARLHLPDPVRDALAGERAALRVVRRIRDGLGTGDELLGELRDIVHDDDGNFEPSVRLRAFCRSLQKHIEAGR